ncbi:MAG: sigma-70 family RNA polymerase sigma factor [Planctomycetes bacterium]|nr:sigma-70 family RNA polymerase sigma factor [Planctomycetota bacterium]
MSTSVTDVTSLLDLIHGGDVSAREALWSRVYDELRHLAAGQMSREREGHTLQPTALVHEAWLRLAPGAGSSFENRAHFFGVAAEAMRRILVEHARRRSARRRGGDKQRRGLDDSVFERVEAQGVVAFDEVSSDLEAVDAALARLEATGRHARKCEVVKLRFFVGLTVEQTAEVLATSPASVKRDWDFAKAWLSREAARLTGDRP